MKKVFSSLLAFAMVLAMFSGVVVFNASADGEVEMHIPFINQYTLEQAQQMGTKNTWSSGNSSNGSDYVFSKDDQDRTVITATVAPELDSQWHVSSLYFSTGTSATPYTKNGLINGIDIFGDAELSNKTKIAFKWGGDENFTANFSNANLMFGSGSERAVISLQSPTKSNGYYIYDFSKIKLNNYDESGIDTIDKAFDGRVNTLTFAMVFRTPGIRVSFWLEDVYVVGTTDTVALHKAIREARANGIPESVITDAENVYKNTASTQDEVDAQTEYLNALLSVNKADLIELYNSITPLDTKGEYTSELSAARDVINSLTATQEDVDAQIAILTPIYEALVAAIPPFDRGFTYTQLPGFQDWDDDLLAAYNEQCELKVNGTTGTHAEFSTEHLRGKATKSLKLVQSGTPTPNAWTVGFSTCGNAADKQAASQLGDVLGSYDTLKQIFQFDGIRIAVENANGDEPSLNTWDGSSEQKVQLRLVGSGTRSWDNGSLPYVSCTRYYRANDETLAYNAQYYDGYYYFFFKDFNSGWGGNAYEKYLTSNWKYSNLYFHLATGGINAPNYNGGAIYISDMQFFTTPPEPTPENLKALVNRANELDVFGKYYDYISSADAVASNPVADTEKISTFILPLLDIISEIEETEPALREHLDDLIELADNLGMFASSDPNYETLVMADQVLTSQASGYADVAKAVVDVRRALCDVIFGDELAPLALAAANAWKYNYVPATYAPLARAYDAIWADTENVDEEEAAATLSAALNALELASIIESDESWFADWTTELVQAVVEQNSEKLCDSIGNGLNRQDVWNAGDFSNNTEFTAGSGAFSMKAQADFTRKAIGWKNMDRSGENPEGVSNTGYPALNFTSIRKYGGLRIKIDVDGGSAERLLFGLSNCISGNREMYAIKIKPEFVASDGYINIPFSYFEKAWWGSAFTADDIDDVVVFIVEAYNVTNGTTVTISDVHAYTQILVAENKAELFALVTDAASLNNGRYDAALAEANNVLNDEFASEADIADAEELMRRVIESASYNGDGTHYIDSVDLPFFQEWTAADCESHNECVNQSEVAISDKCLVGDAFQSIEAAGFGDNAFIVSNCSAGEDINTEPALGDPFAGFNTDFEYYEGIRFAITDGFGLTPAFSSNTQLIFTLYGDGTEANAPSFTATYNVGNFQVDADYLYVRFADMIASSGSVPTFAELDPDKQENYKLFTLKLTGTGIVANNGGALYFSDVQFFSQHEILPRDELIQLIENIKKLDVDNLFEDDIYDAEQLCANIRATQEEIDEMIAWLTEIYDALVDNGNFDSSDIVATFGAVADPVVDKSEGATKLLMIGNSFSWNAYEYINQIAEAAGVNLVVANLNYGGCSLQQHDDFMHNNKAVYGYQRSWGSGLSNYTAAQALADQDWDYISIQQVSGKAGRPETYQPYMHNVIEYIKERCPNAEIIWHQTWAYQKTSDHSDFPYFNKDQDYMWQCIEATSKQMCAEEGIRYIVPSGKAFQNARATSIGDNLNTDGYHANAMGCYLAGYCFFSTVTGSLPSTSSYRPSSVSEADWKLLRRAVTDAVTEYGYVTYRKDGKYIPALEKLTRAASTGKIDGMMVAGNIVKNSSDDIESFKAVNSDYIPGAAIMYTLGENDYALSSNAAMLYSTLMKEYLTDDLEPATQKRKGNRHIKVSGIDIFGVAYDKVTDGFATYADETLEWLDTELAAIEGDMPIFVVTSFPVTHTIGSRGASRICDVLRKYPNIVVFSGGTHEGVTDDLIIHNDGFTAVNVGSLSDETANGLMVEVDGSGNVRIRRYDFITGAEYSWFIINADGSSAENYSAGYYEAPVVNIADGAEFDVAEGAPVMTWLQDGEKATLDGEPCEYGASVTEAGQHTLVVTAGDKQTSVTFTVIDNTEEPVVSIEDGAEFDLYTADEPIAATWTPEEATATLNGEAYTAGTEISEVGEYALIVTNGTKSVTVNFTVIDSRPPYKKGDFNSNGKIEVDDALAALRIAARLAEETPESILIGDTDGDGHVTVADALAILRVAAKLADEGSL